MSAHCCSLLCRVNGTDYLAVVMFLKLPVIKLKEEKNQTTVLLKKKINGNE